MKTFFFKNTNGCPNHDASSLLSRSISTLCYVRAVSEQHLHGTPYNCPCRTCMLRNIFHRIDQITHI